MGFFSRKNKGPVVAANNLEQQEQISTEPKKEEAPVPHPEESQVTSSPAVNTTEETKENPQINSGEEYDHENEDVEAPQEWDEGGPSHCGYHVTVHDTLMTVGETVHSVVGDPPEIMDSGMKQVGNWFQEASYAVRDFMRGDKGVRDDAGQTFVTMTGDLAAFVGSKDEDDDKAPVSSSMPKLSPSPAV